MLSLTVKRANEFFGSDDRPKAARPLQCLIWRFVYRPLFFVCAYMSHSFGGMLSLLDAFPE